MHTDRSKRSLTTIAVSCLLVITLAGCDDANGSNTTPTPRPPTTAPTDTPTPSNTPSPSSSGTSEGTESSSTTTPSPTTPVEKNKAAAGAAVTKFVAVTDQLRIKPKTSLERLVTVARHDSATKWRQFIIQDRTKGWRQTGKRTVEIESAKPTGKRWRVRACIDVSSVDVVDKKGKSVVAKDRPDRVRNQYTVEKDGEKYYVIKDELVNAKC